MRLRVRRPSSCRRYRVHAANGLRIPPKQVVGASGVTNFQIGPDGKPVLMKEAKIGFIDDGPGTPPDQPAHRPAAELHLRNSDGDQQMLQWTAAGSGARFMALVHHTDAVREFAYDRQRISASSTRRSTKPPRVAGPLST